MTFAATKVTVVAIAMPIGSIRMAIGLRSGCGPSSHSRRVLESVMVVRIRRGKVKAYSTVDVYRKGSRAPEGEGLGRNQLAELPMMLLSVY